MKKKKNKNAPELRLLPSIHTVEDLRRLPDELMPQLAEEIRSYLIVRVKSTGGHLASNLGVVELTLALHRVFDTPRDRIIWDVGHQCYVHKLVTGRADRFDTLRTPGGLSGFPRHEESEFDPFDVGHASTSISAALGFATADALAGVTDRYTVAVIGDGALTGGLAHEALNNCKKNYPMVIIINENDMSISPVTGSFPRLVSRLRISRNYQRMKSSTKRAFLKVPLIGKPLYYLMRGVRNFVRGLLYRNNYFEDMGFTYLGPVNGHDVGQLTNTLKWAKDLNCPVLVHVHTKKGKGYPPAEREPERYHGVGKFDPRMGVPREHKRDFSAVFGDELCKLAKNDETICAITAAMRDGTGLHDFSEQYPVRFFDVGIAEGHAVAMAAGMAKQGLTPVVAIYSSFLQRAYDQLIHDTALSDLHVVFAVDRAGMVGADGETHHGIFDATFLSEIPNMTVLCPSNFAELRTMLDRAVNEIKGPVAIRYPRGGEGNYKEDSGRQNLVVLREGADITLCAYGTMINNVLGAAEILHEQGIEARVVKINAISPLYDRDMREVIGKTKAMLVAEECAGVGCMGQRMAAILGWNKISPERLELCNLGKAFPAQGTVEELYREFGLDAESLAKKAAEVLR